MAPVDQTDALPLPIQSAQVPADRATASISRRILNDALRSPGLRIGAAIFVLLLLALPTVLKRGRVADLAG